MFRLRKCFDIFYKITNANVQAEKNQEIAVKYKFGILNRHTEEAEMGPPDRSNIQLHFYSQGGAHVFVLSSGKKRVCFLDRSGIIQTYHDSTQIRTRNNFLQKKKQFVDLKKNVSWNQIITKNYKNVGNVKIKSWVQYQQFI